MPLNPRANFVSTTARLSVSPITAGVYQWTLCCLLVATFATADVLAMQSKALPTTRGLK